MLIGISFEIVLVLYKGDIELSIMHNGTVFSKIMVLSGYLLCKWGFLWGFEFVISKMIGNLILKIVNGKNNGESRES